MVEKKNIGFLSYWGTDRGLSSVTLDYVKKLQDSDWNVFILKQGTNDVTGEFAKVKATITEYPDYVVPPEIFEKWILDNKIDIILFNEYDQWGDSGTDLVNLANKLGCKTLGYLIMEKFKKEQTIPYDRIIVPTVSQMKMLRNHKVRKFTRIPFTIDLKEFPKEKREESNDKFTFFHPAGMGGYKDRKNTRAVIKAFELLSKEKDDIKLVISSQKPLPKINNPNIEIINKNLPRKELLQKYWEADFTILPSKWETIGIPCLESLACFTPVLVSDIPPLNEFIQEGLNGYVAKCDYETYDDISVLVGEVRINDLVNKMKMAMNKSLHDLLRNNSREVINRIYDLEKNKDDFVKFLDNMVK